MSEDISYTGSQIQLLEGLQALRKRPGMYLGCSGSSGLQELLRCVLLVPLEAASFLKKPFDTRCSSF